VGEIAVRVEGLSKRYELGGGRHDTLRELIMDRVGRLGRSGESAPSARSIWALKDVTFEVRRGEAVGLIGRNGAGKSTLLKVLSRITEPTSGRAEIFGRVGSLLEVGTGFSGELTGRDNIYLSGAILGMRKAEIDRRFEEIVEFSEVGQFLDTPVKRYSSGMYVRLAFAVAAHLEPEILFVDEVLAVGDAAFQRKCLGRMRDVTAEQSRTIIFVSHNMAAITRLCKWAVWIDGGRVREIGPAADVAMNYLSQGHQDTAELTFADPAAAPGSEYIRLIAVRLRDNGGPVTAAFRQNSSPTIEIEYQVLQPTVSARIGFTLFTMDGLEILKSVDTNRHPERLERSPGKYRTYCRIPAGFLRSGQYTVSIGCSTANVQTHFHLDRAMYFRVEEALVEGDDLYRGGGLVRLLSSPWALERIDTRSKPA
jgi:lipopolysaccharide transport system ATP-binding protein